MIWYWKKRSFGIPTVVGRRGFMESFWVHTSLQKDAVEEDCSPQEGEATGITIVPCSISCELTDSEEDVDDSKDALRRDSELSKDDYSETNSSFYIQHAAGFQQKELHHRNTVR